MKWRIAFLGTFHPAVLTLRQLAERGWISLVVLPEEAGAKNDGLLELVHEYSLPWTYNLSDIDRYEVDLILAANYPKLVPSRYLRAYPCINTHWSLLPKYRGIHPTAWALLNHDYEVGFTIHWMEGEFDTGDILVQEVVHMQPDMNIMELHAELAERQAHAVVGLLEMRLQTGEWSSRTQIHEQATYVPQRVPEDGIIDWSWPTERIWNLVRALPAPMYPGAFTYLRNEKLIIWRAKPADCPPYFTAPGQVVRVMKNYGVWVKTEDTCLEILEVELEGSNQGTQRADQVLKRGDKLGYNPQLEIAGLHQVVAELTQEIEDLRAEVRSST